MSGDSKAAIIDRLRTAADNSLGCTWEPGCGCVYCAAVDEIERLSAQVRAAQDRAVGLDFAAERALEMIESGRYYDAQDTLARVLGSGRSGS